MPTYGYECQKCKEQFEIVQKITEDSLKIHEGCGGDLKKLVYPVGISFKGSGFYVNDYNKTSPKAKPAATDEKATTESTTTTETKTETKTETTTPATPTPAAAPASPAPSTKSEK
ncbi:MAG: FmdB family zinc ribbon protein [Chthonomonadales bacterium]